MAENECEHYKTIIMEVRKMLNSEFPLMYIAEATR